MRRSLSPQCVDDGPGGHGQPVDVVVGVAARFAEGAGLQCDDLDVADALREGVGVVGGVLGLGEDRRDAGVRDERGELLRDRPGSWRRASWATG